MRFKFLSLGAMLSAMLATPSHAEIDSGAYLAGRTAAMNNDFLAASQYFTKSLRSDPTNKVLIESALAAHSAIGNFDTAVALADVLGEFEDPGQLANLVALVDSAKRGAWDEILSGIEAGRVVNPIVDGLAQAWAFVGTGETDRAIATFEDLRDTNGMENFALFHHGLALASKGDFVGADAILSQDGNRYTTQSAIAHAQVLSQLDRNDDALAVLDAVFGKTSDPTISTLQTRLAAGETLPFDIAPTPREGIAELMFLVAQLLGEEAPRSFPLQYTRMAEILNPRHTRAILMSGELLEELGQFELASDTYSRIKPDDPAYSSAELGRIDVLRLADDVPGAIDAAKALLEAYPNLAAAHEKLGDNLRIQERYGDAIAAYSDALDLIPVDQISRWVVLYKRAISYHLSDNWPPAEADFRAALALNPTQPLVLNYLGYSLVERGEKLDEALSMIEEAVAGAPENGAIIDSLGWVLFQLGRYEESVGYMERAASLEALDPIVNDHLGDVYWAVGRWIEADFQWNRALSLDPDDELAERIRRKLEVGLDKVLEEEGAEPLRAD